MSCDQLGAAKQRGWYGLTASIALHRRGGIQYCVHLKVLAVEVLLYLCLHPAYHCLPIREPART